MNKIFRNINKVRKLLNVNFDDIIYCQNNILNELKSINNKLDKNNYEVKNQICEIKNNLQSIYKEFDYSNLEMNKLIKSDFNKKQILICGFYGAINLGDDLMLETLLTYLDKIDDLEITIMLCDKKNIDITNYGKYNFIHYPTRTDDFNIIAKYFDAVIFGGGALLDDYEYNDDSPIFNLGYILINLALEFINFNKTTILYGLSSNKQINNKQYIKKLNLIAEKSSVFTLRDTNSFETLKKSGINVSKIKIVDDIVLSNKLLNKMVTKKFDKIKLGIVYICSNEYYSYLYEYTKNIINYLENNNYDYELTFIPFYNHLNNDEELYKRLVKDLNNNKLFISSMPKKYEDIKNIFENQEYIVSMRYHATLMANFMNKNVLSINFVNHRHYFNKIDYIYSNYNFERNTFDFTSELKKDNLDLLFSKHKYKKHEKILLKAQNDIVLYVVKKKKKIRKKDCNEN